MRHQGSEDLKKIESDVLNKAKFAPLAALGVVGQ